MPISRGTRPTYRNNPRPGRRTMFGRKAQDDIDGHWTYEGLLTTDDFGNQVDPTDRRTFDIRYDLDGENGG